jgi:putative ABC transport system permease protein
VRQFLRRLWHAIRQRQFEADLAEEIDFHGAMKQREVEERGVDPREATFAARRALGSIALAQDYSRDVWCPRWLQGIGQDLRVALRMLRATPLVTVIAIVSLVLGIGANTAIFSLVDSLILRPLAVAEPDRLAILSTTTATNYRPPYTYTTFDEVRRLRLFDGAAAFTTCCSRSTITVRGETESVYRQFFSGDFFDTLGVRAYVGRLFTPADDVTGGGSDGQVVVISYQLWTNRFGRTPTIVGTLLHVDRASLTIIGVLPPDFFGLEVGRAFDIGMPLHTELELGSNARYDADTPILGVLLRLKRDQTLSAATAALRAAQPQIRAVARPRSSNGEFLKDPFTLESFGASTSALRQRFERPLLLIFVVVGLVLLIACANLANLLLARCAARRHELSVRVALGASSWQLVRQFFVESLVLSTIGTLGGVVFALWTTRALVAQLSTSTTPVVLNLFLDWRVLAFAAAAMVATTIVFGMAPAVRGARAVPINALKERMGGGEQPGSAGMTDGLVVAQVALSLVLIVAAGLFVRTFENLARASLGFDRDRVLSVTVNAQAVPASDRNGLYHQLVHAAEAVPGVVRAGGSINPPLVGGLVGDFVVSAPGAPPAPDAERISQNNSITPGWLAAFGTPIHAGRDIDETDTKNSAPVMVVNEAFVRRFFRTANPVGAVLAVTARLAPDGDFPVGVKTIVGVVGDAVYRSVRDRGRPTIYLPLAQWGDGNAPLPYVNFFMAVRFSTISPTSPIHSVAAALTAVKPNLTFTFRPVSDQVDDSLAQDRLVAMLAGFFGALALLLSGLGLYGVTAYSVARRRTEIGIRLALGAAPASIVRLALSRVSLLVGIGTIVGTVVSLWFSRFVVALLYGLEPRDPAMFISAAGVLTAVAGVAAGLPAWRASRTDPAAVLREQ